jgi:hypothetical protein
MNNQHKQRIRQRDERGTVAYWRKRAEDAEREVQRLEGELIAVNVKRTARLVCVDCASKFCLCDIR